MDTLHKNRMIFWVLMFLVVVNLSALVTFFTFRSHKEVASCETMGPQCGQAFKSELGLSPGQVEKVEKINADYQSASVPIVEQIRNIRSDILDELSKEVPDTSFIRLRSGEICNFQLELQQANFTQFLELKKVCDPGQAKKLSALYRELYGCSGMGEGKGTMERHMGGRN
jgi:hypothetical protein